MVTVIRSFFDFTFEAAASAVTLFFAPLRHIASRRTRTTRVMSEIHQSVLIMRDVVAKVRRDKFATEDIPRALIDVLQPVEAAFRLLKGARCKAQVKLIKLETADSESATVEDLRVANFAVPASGPEVPLSVNELWQEVHLRPEVRAYVRTYDPFGNEPAQSCIVWPIRSIITASGQERDQELFGFLVVTCDRKNAFSLEQDFHIGAVIADCLCTVLVDIYATLAKPSERANREVVASSRTGGVELRTYSQPFPIAG